MSIAPWPFQEAVLPREVFFLIGQQSISIQQLLLTIETIGHRRVARMLLRVRTHKKSGRRVRISPSN
jgi:hypothetical protein